MTASDLPTWKRVLFKGIGIGVGIALALSAIADVLVWYSNRPKAETRWNESTIKATYTDLFLTRSDRLVAEFRYSLRNTTTKDYRLPSDSKLMARLARDKSYRDFPNMTWEQNLYIPSGQTVNVSIMLPIMYSDFNFSEQKANDEKQLFPFVGKRPSEIDGFVLFDQMNRYKVDFPNGWPEPTAREKMREEPEAVKSISSLSLC